MKEEFSCGIVPVLVSKTGPAQFLLIRQTTGHWGFPKGHVEPGETAIEAAKRELKEETGISDISIIDNFSYTQSYVFQKNGEEVSKSVTFFIANVSNDVVSIKKDEIQDYGWFEYEAAREQLSYPSSQDLLNSVVTKLKTLNQLV